MKKENYAFALVMELLVSVGDRNRCVHVVVLNTTASLTMR